MPRYFKLVVLHEDPEWILEEFRQGRVRFGWSGPGSDQRAIGAKPWGARTAEERNVWRFTKFLIERIEPGDRVVLQHRSPLRSFLVAEVSPSGYDSSGTALPDFNHFLHCTPLVAEPVPVNADYVPAFVKHDLTKRGHYYEIYPSQSVSALDEIIEQQPWTDPNRSSTRGIEDELDGTFETLKAHTIEQISLRWPAKSFELFCAELCARLDYVEVKEQKDRFKGWDMLVRILDPITGEPLLEDVPVQCKNYRGRVTTTQPIDDLVRCFRSELNCSVAYLFILGDLSEEFRHHAAREQARLQEELGRAVDFRIIEQDRIAELYLSRMSQQGGATGISMRSGAP